MILYWKNGVYNVIGFRLVLKGPCNTVFKELSNGIIPYLQKIFRFCQVNALSYAVIAFSTFFPTCMLEAKQGVTEWEKEVMRCMFHDFEPFSLSFSLNVWLTFSVVTARAWACSWPLSVATVTMPLMILKSANGHDCVWSVIIWAHGIICRKKAKWLQADFED